MGKDDIMGKVIIGVIIAVVVIIILSAIFGGGLWQTIVGLGLGGSVLFLGG